MPELKKHRCDTALDFVKRLSPFDENIWPDSRNYIFRGQPDERFTLTPSAHRPVGQVTAALSYGEVEITTSQQVRFELAVVRQFLEGSDLCGFQVPGDSPKARELLQNPADFIGKPNLWPPAELHQIMAAAQHHGIPTCLLDWTRRQYVAAYFAASSALHLDYEPENIAVWAISTTNNAKWKGLRLVQTAGATSPNLAAQSGLFTLSTLEAVAGERFFSSLNRWEKGFASTDDFQKLTLPFSEVKPLLMLLNKLGISAATLFPGYEGMARAVRDWAQLNRRLPDPDPWSVSDLL